MTFYLLIALDEGLRLVLVLSAAFEAIDHQILIEWLDNLIGIKGAALNWFKSYLSDRTQSVHVNNDLSMYIKVNYEVYEVP